MKRTTPVVGKLLDTSRPIKWPKKVWRTNTLFKGIENLYLEVLEQELQSEFFLKGSTIIREGETGNCLYVIEKGAVEIQKAGHHLALKTSGEHFGAMALMDNKARSADVIAKTDVKVKVLCAPVFQNLPYEEVRFKILQNHIRHQQSLLRATNEVAINEKEAKIAVESRNQKAVDFLVTLLIWLIAYQFLLGFIFEFSTHLRNAAAMDIINPSMMLILGLGAFFKAFKSDLPFSFYGINLNNWQKNLKESLAFTGVFLVGLVGFKYLLTLYAPGFKDEPVIDMRIMENYSITTLLAIYIGYTLLVPVQEFIVRGVTQGTLTHMLPLKNKVPLAILISNLFFCAFHIHANLLFATMIFIPGVFWGIMYHRQQSILGVSVSHTIIGLFTLLCLNLLKF